VPGPNKSKKVDFALCQVDRRHVHFIEFKTDQSSRDDAQDRYLDVATTLSFRRILDGVRLIREATLPRYRPKYDELMARIGAWGFSLDATTMIAADSTKVVRWYLQPQPGDQHTIGFAEFAQFLRSVGGDFAEDLAPFFDRWACSPGPPAT
jgi:hypothetical protein